MPLSPDNLRTIRKFGGQIPPPRKRGDAGAPGVNKQLPQTKTKGKGPKLAKGASLKLKGLLAKKMKKAKKKKPEPVE